MIEISGIIKESFLDGIGIRTVIFFQGCEHACPGCQNPHTQKKGNGAYVTIPYILSVIESDELSKGVTFSGGCPLCNAENIISLAKELKEKGYNIWCYCGEKIEELKGKQLELLRYIDVLVDGKYMKELRDDTLAFRGSKNQRIINVKEYLGGVNNDNEKTY